jgi:cytochrome c-type biogenesis protein CcmH
MRLVLVLLGSLLLASALPVAAIPVGTPLEFDSPKQEETYQNLIRELRCTVCQNQSLVDSNAGLARDLRSNIYQLIHEGQDQAQITQYMVSRYGDFVLYRPPLQPSTYLLWFGPFLFLAVGVLVLVLVVGGRKRLDQAPLSPEERTRLDAITRGKS